MSATDELRKLLNERGVEHSDFASAYRLSTRWQDSSRRVIEHQLRKDADIGDMGIVRNLTPEQAIAATLGSGTCERVPGRVFPKCSACGATMGRVDNYCSNCGRKVVDV